MDIQPSHLDQAMGRRYEGQPKGNFLRKSCPELPSNVSTYNYVAILLPSHTCLHGKTMQSVTRKILLLGVEIRGEEHGYQQGH